MVASNLLVQALGGHAVQTGELAVQRYLMATQHQNGAGNLRDLTRGASWSHSVQGNQSLPRTLSPQNCCVHSQLARAVLHPAVEGEGGNDTMTRSPRPSGPALSVSVAPWASAIVLTIARPKPLPGGVVPARR